MANNLGLIGCMVVVAALLLHGAAAQSTYVVGDSLGWTVPPSGPVAYSTWALAKTFNAGDILVFNFTTGQHDVAKVSKADYENCTKTNSIGDVQNTGPANFTVESGEHYYICTIDSHCSLGQKVTISTNRTNPSNSSPKNTLPTGSFTLALLSIAVAFFH